MSEYRTVDKVSQLSHAAISEDLATNRCGCAKGKRYPLEPVGMIGTIPIVWACDFCKMEYVEQPARVILRLARAIETQAEEINKLKDQVKDLKMSPK